MKLNDLINKIKLLALINLKNLSIPYVILQYLVFYSRRKRRTRHLPMSAGNIVVVGGELFNKGSQGMTFTVVDRLSRKYPGIPIYLFSVMDANRSAKEKSLYKFAIRPWTQNIQLGIFNNILSMLIRNKKNIISDLEYIIKNSKYFIDISGYALSSQWGFIRSFYYLLNIMIAAKYHVPYYIFPQSIGPLYFNGWNKLLLSNLLIGRCLNYPEKIFVREQESVDTVGKLVKKNVYKAFDIVLGNKEYDISNIFYKKYKINKLNIKNNSVGIIPNLRILERIEEVRIFNLYTSIISELLSNKKIIYILRHSFEDLDICKKVKSLFAGDSRVHFIADDLNAIELEYVIKQFDYIVASCYHAIVHAYRHGIPALVIGWARKYYELLSEFHQLDYFFDIRDKLYTKQLILVLNKLNSKIKDEKEVIKNLYENMCTQDVFSVLR